MARYSDFDQRQLDIRSGAEMDRQPPPRRFPSFTCPACSAVSYNVTDVLERYCGAYHRFFPPKPMVAASNNPR